VAAAALAMLIAVPDVLQILLTACVVAVTLVQVVISVAGLARPLRATSTHTTVLDSDLPSYTVIIPAYMEHEVIGGMVRCLETLDYPRDRLEALLLVERRDHATKQAIRDANPASFIRIVEIPPGEPQTKPRSCNAGLLLAKGDLIVVFDAEDRPHCRQLRIAAEHFIHADEDLACVQAKLVVSNANQSFITRQFALEYCLRYELTLPGLARLGLPVPLGGTSNHFKTRLLREVGGWDAWNVTEDADLGMRCSASGYRVEVIDSPTLGQMPHSPAAWTRQRTRWLKGFMLTALVHTRSPRRTWQRFGWAGTLTLLAFMAGTPLLYLAQSLALVLLAANYDGLFVELNFTALKGLAVVLASVQLATLLIWVGVAVLAARRRQMLTALFAPLLPAYWVMLWIASWRAVHQLITAPYVWEKTPHATTTGGGHG